MDEERREFFRVMVRLPVRCLAVAADGSASLMMVRSVDLSAGGVCVVTDRSLGRGDGVRLAFEVADGTPFKLEGHVARAERLARRDAPLRARVRRARPCDRAAHVQGGVRAGAGERGPPRARPHDGLGAGDLPARRRALDFPAHALQLSADDVQVITRRSLSVGERIRVAMDDAGLGFRIDADADVAEVLRDHRGSHVATLAFDGLDRVTRSSILRRAMEQERRELAGE